MAFDNIITYSDFTNETWYIDTSKDTTQAKLTDVITKYQKIIYKDLFGEALYNYLHDNKTGAVYTTLVAGETVTIDGYKYTWEGLSAMLIPFVYYYYKKDVESFGTTIGEKKGETENATRANSELNRELLESWNEGVDLYLDARDYMDYKNELVTDTYPELKTNYDNFGKKDNYYGL